MAYFSERERGPQSRTGQTITENFTKGVLALITGHVANGWFGISYPARCFDPDFRGVYGTDPRLFADALTGTLNLTWPFPDGDQVDDLVLLDVIEFAWDKTGLPIQVSFHDHMGHPHLRFDQNTGREQFRQQINDLFSRHGLGFELQADGRVIRLAPEEIRAKLIEAVFDTGDVQLDELLNDARKKFLDPDPATRRDGLEKLWDAFQRLRTVEPGRDTRARATALIEAAYNEADVRNRLNTELLELANIGNQYNIRHFETDKLPIPDDKFVDYLYSRCYSAVYLLLDKTGRVRH